MSHEPHDSAANGEPSAQPNRNIRPDHQTALDQPTSAQSGSGEQQGNTKASGGRKVGAILGGILLVLAVRGGIYALKKHNAEHNESDSAANMSINEDSTDSGADGDPQGSHLPAAAQQSPTVSPDAPEEFLEPMLAAARYVRFHNPSESVLYQTMIHPDNGYSGEEAQYVLSHLDLDFNDHALKTADRWRNKMDASRATILDTLEREEFTPEQIDWAMQHLEADYNQNALCTAPHPATTLQSQPSVRATRIEWAHGFPPSRCQWRSGRYRPHAAQPAWTHAPAKTDAASLMLKTSEPKGPCP